MGERKVNNENLDQPARCIRAACQHRCLFTCDRPRLTLDDPDMGDWTYTYDALGNLTSQTDARSCTTTLVYDVLNRVTDKTYGTGCPTTTAVSYTYDAGTYGIGQRTGMTDGSGATSWTYDVRGRVILETRSIEDSAMYLGDFTTQWTYNSADQVATIQYPSDNANGLGETVTYTYLPQMALDTMIGTTEPDEDPVIYISDTQYDYAGRITTRKLSSSNFRQNYTYVGWTSIGGGRLDTLKTGTNAGYYNNLQSLDYDYDAIGNITSIKNFRNSNQVQCFGYDAMDRLVSGFTASSTTCPQYAAVGNGAYQESYSYESATGNLSSKGGADYEYAAAHPHAVQQIVDEDNQVNTAITVRARGVYNVSWPTMKLYVNGELRQTWTVNSTTYANYTVTTPVGANAIIEVRRETPTQIGGSTSGSLYVDYVTVGGVTRQSEGGAAFLDWGRGTSAVDWQNVVMGQESINSDGALRFAFGPLAFAGNYDANGNLTHRLVNNAATIMSYDAENRLVQVSGATTATFVYNGDGERVRSTVNGTTTAFIGSILEWTGSTTTMIRYYYAGAARIAMRTGTGAPQYILSDHLGSTSVTTSSEGVYQSEVMYKPWGETRWTSGTLPTKYTYTGQYSNVADFGLMYYNARWYDSTTSRFSQADTIIPNPGDPQSWDRYAYVRNNPTGRIDPTGHMDDDGDGGGCESAECRRNARTQFQKRHISNRPQHFILICGVWDGGNCSGEQRLSPYMRFGNTSIYDVDDCGPKSNCANDVFMQIYQNPSINYYIIGHSAGADAAILAAERSLEHNLKNLKGIVLLDPTLTASAGNEFGNFSNTDHIYGTEDDLGFLMPKIITHNISVFVGTGKDANYTDSTNPNELTNYLSLLATNMSEIETEFYSYNTYPLSHESMAIDQKVANDVKKFLNPGR
ncbi:MAG TPA: RHS repeat-associated core domain-containing protein [Anaerolineaceae bacterium]|nr:RHS repeat-associated core domain-containing protein [Anaerolineaceae bacterium]